MYRGCRRLVCSLVCVFSILCMLYLDTCTVKAANGYADYTASYSFTVNPDTHNVTNYSTSTGGYISNGTGSLQVIGGWTQWIGEGTWHFKIPLEHIFSISSDYSISNFDYEKYYLMEARINSLSCNIGSISNAMLYDYEGNFIGTSGGYWNKFLAGRGYDFHNVGAASSQDYTAFRGYLEFDYTYESRIYTDYGGTGANDHASTDSFGLTLNFNINTLLIEISADEFNAYKEQVSDSGTQSAVEEGNEISEDTNTKITDFFGSFFDNLLHIFVPEDGYFSTWFDKVNTLLSDKLGMLYAPFDLVISTLQAIYNADSSESGIPFPGIKWEDTWLVEPFTFTFASLGDSFDDLRDKVYFATDTVLVLTFLMLLQSKVKLILEGHE